MHLVPADSLRASTYNPRKSDATRLGIVEESLRRLGWLLPIYASPDGEIISGHQRSYVAVERLGAKHLPVVYLEQFTLNERKAVNILFNRATNDQARHHTPSDLTGSLLSTIDSTLAAARELPDLSRDDSRWFRCLEPQTWPIQTLLDKNVERFQKYLTLSASSLRRQGVVMPIVADPHGVVINGLGRLEDAAENRRQTVSVIEVSPQEAQVAAPMLNLLTMDFDIHIRYADFLRHNSFRRHYGAKESIGVAFIFDGMGDKTLPKNVDLLDRSTAAKWIKHYGRRVLDFGCGLNTDAPRLKSIGVVCDTFEPYRLDNTEINIAQSISCVREFLERVRSASWSSIFLNSIMNSVPFLSDRQHIVQIVSALCGSATTVYPCAASTQQSRFQAFSGRGGASAENAAHFPLDYEPRVTLAEISGKPKVQKFHTAAEWRELWQTGFREVRSRSIAANLVGATCRQPLPIDPAKLRAAIEFEFDLPYPDGSRMGLVAEALAAFEERTDIKLS